MTIYGGGVYYGGSPVYGGIPSAGDGAFNGWAVSLNGVMLTVCELQADWDSLGCAPQTVIPGLDAVPDGLGLPGLRTEDVTYFQRDGVKHFSDWYEPRIITIQGTLGPTPTGTDCVSGNCSSVREQLQELVQAWKRGCCDTELVVFTDCYTPDFTDGTNVYPDGTFDVDEDGWTGVDGATVARVTTPVHSGAGALEITWDDDPVPYDDPSWTGQTALGATLTGLTQGDRYQISAWLYAATGQPMPVLGCKDSSDDGLVYSDPVIADDSWFYTTVDYVVPDSGELIPFVVNGEPTTAGDIAYIDDVQAMKYADVNRTLNGPFGIVGRPREFKYQWAYRDDQVVEFVARFDAVDQRMYVLDECGTPGFSECVTINPGPQLFSRCYVDGSGPYEGMKVRCRGGTSAPSGGTTRCYSNPEVEGSVDPEPVSVAGTERVYPTIVLQPTLQNPRIENMTTGEYVTFEGTVGDLPVTINTEDGTAFDSEGESFTHLLGGSLFLSMDPGNYEWRLLATGTPDGYASLCFRNTIVSA